MVSWATPGKMSGYSGTDVAWKADIYSFNVAGSVDVNAATRLQYTLPNSDTNRLYVTGSFTLESGDLAPNNITRPEFIGGRQFTATLFLAPASAFAPGAIPTPTQILAASTIAQRAPQNRYTAGTLAVTLPGIAPSQLQVNTKYWALFIPTTIENGNQALPASVATDKPLVNIGVDTIGRALSFWANRTPNAPTITSPVSGSVVAPGDTFTFTYNPGDPDSNAVPDSMKLNRDLGGVQIQYAPVPTASNPSPEWLPLRYQHMGEVVIDAEYIRGQTNGGNDLLDDLGTVVRVGPNQPALPGEGGLPSGSWQIRVRTADFGHPLPASYPPANMGGAVTFATYPSVNISPWSAPVRVTVPAQVPLPTLLSPIKYTAVVENANIRLSWKYRNTATPPFPQASRTVQIRKVGDPSWTTLASGAGSDDFLMVAKPIPQTEVIPDGDFEEGTLGGFLPGDDPLGASTEIENLENPAIAWQGSHCLQVWTNVDGPALTYRRVALTPGHRRFSLSCWAAPIVGFAWPAFDTDDVVSASLRFFDADGNLLSTASSSWSGWTDWTQILWDGSWLDDAAYMEFSVYADTATPGKAAGFWLDEVSFVTSQPTSDITYPFEANTLYEWRVSVTDTDGVSSGYTASERFWVAPEPASGGTRPLPAETIDGASLGCGTHRVFIYKRGGAVRVGELRGITSVDWERVRDEISTSKIVVTDWDIDCGNLLAQLQTWAYEVVIFRDNGFSVDRVWEGPITLLTYERDTVTIQAKDVMGYAYRRIIRQEMNDSGGATVVDRATRILQNAFAPDDPNILSYLTPLIRDDDPNQRRNTPAYSRTAYEEIDDMASNSGLDYVTVGRSILLWGTHHRIGVLPEFRDEDLGSPPIVSEYGMSMANVYSVSNGNGIHGEATRLDVSGNDPVYGLVEMLSSSWASDEEAEQGIYTGSEAALVEDFENFAERSIANKYPPPVVVRVPDNSTLSPDAVISIQQLVPGVAIPLRSTGTLRTVVQAQKLDSVRVTEAAGVETITVTMSPFYRDDTETEEGDL